MKVKRNVVIMDLAGVPENLDKIIEIYNKDRTLFFWSYSNSFKFTDSKDKDSIFSLEGFLNKVYPKTYENLGRTIHASMPRIIEIEEEVSLLKYIIIKLFGENNFTMRRSGILNKIKDGVYKNK